MSMTKRNENKIDEASDLDSGFLSGQHSQSDSFLLSAEQPLPADDDHKNQQQQSDEIGEVRGGVASFKQQQQLNQKEIEMDSALIDSGCISQSQISEEVSGDLRKMQLLHLAIIWPHEEAAHTLIALSPHPACLNIQNDVFLAPIHIACLTNQPKILRELLLAGAKPTMRDRRGNTALHLACQNGLVDCVKQLLTPFIGAEMKRLRSAEKFPQDLELWNYDGETCVHSAAKTNQLEILKVLVSAGADINAREGKSGQTILHKAVAASNETLVKFLLKDVSTVDLEAETYAGLTAYQLAAAAQNSRFSAELASRGAEQIPLPEESDAESDDESTSYVYDEKILHKNFNGQMPVNVA